MKRILLSAVMAFVFVAFASAQTTYYSEDFEAGQPAGWTLDGGWTYGAAADLGSAYLDLTANTTNFIAFNDDALGENHSGGGRAESSNYDLTAVTGTAFMEYNYFFSNGDWEGDDETFKVSVSIDDGANWEELKDYAANGWGVVFLNLTKYVGENVKFAFDYDDGTGWNFGAAIDNIVISDVPYNFVRRDYALTANGGSQIDICAQNIDYSLEGAFYNGGYEVINSFDVNVTRDGVVTTTSYDGLNIEYQEGMKYVIEEKINTGEVNSEVMVSISNVNGDMTDDEVTVDNSAVVKFQPVAVHPDKAVVVEEATGTWCQWCPRGTVYLDEMSKRFGDNFVGIAVHNADPMVLTEYDEAIGEFPGFSGYPSVVYNRANLLDPGEIVTPALADMAEAPEVTVEVGAEENGGSLTSNVRVRFVDAKESADYNVTIVLSEDDLTGEDPAWRQVNRYGLGDVGAMGGFEYFNTSVSSSVWPYSHVGRAIIGGYAGINGVTGNYGAGESNIVEMGDFTMDASWKMENMHIVAIVTNSAGQVVNAKSEKLNDAIANGLLSPGTAVTEIYDASLASVSPNPASDMTNVAINVGTASDVTIQVTDMTGQLVSKRNLGTVAGKQNVSYDVSDLAAGNYVFKVTAGEKVVTQKVSVIK